MAGPTMNLIGDSAGSQEVSGSYLEKLRPRYLTEVTQGDWTSFPLFREVLEMNTLGSD